jgi:tRNA(His) 5'-end guanylyltransferase
MPDALGTPCFDGRVLVADTPEEVGDYLAWRIADSRKNAISSAAHAVFGHSRLVGVGTAERRRMLEGTEWERIPECDYHGRLVAKEPYETHVTWHDRHGVEHEADAVRHRWELRAATDDVIVEMVGRIADVVAGRRG